MDRLRKNVDKLVSRRSDKEFDTFSDPIEDTRHEHWRRHASEPGLRYTHSGFGPPSYENVPVIEGQSLAFRVNSAGSGFSSAPSSVATNPLGLTMVHAFPEPLVDLIFVHGLGGTSVATWSWDRDPANFWIPWLSNEADLSRSRVFTYGYDASLTGPHATVNILDFAKDLLFRMKTYSGPNSSDRIPIGTLPILFVVHSMGGLVVKKAYILGKTDPQFTDMISRIFAIVFLATPHKGSQLAQTLNNILNAVPGGSSKAFVADLEKNSGALQDINEQFRHICGDLQLVSFYETMKTTIGGIKRLIVERDSALLEYPGETSSSLMADHHGMAKFKDPLDANFINVTNVLRFLTKPMMGEKEVLKDSFLPTPLLQVPFDEPLRPGTPGIEQESLLARLGIFLGIKNDHDDEFRLFSEKLHRGSCQWLLRRPSFQNWATNSPKASGYLWISGNPGSGKSTLSSFIINHLQDQSYFGTCQHHFFLAGDKDKKTLAYMLRSIAYQVALSSELFLSRLIELCGASGMNFEQEKVSTIWERVFEGLLFRLPLEEPLFWVIDGLDEAESPAGLLKLVSRIRSAAKINILIVSRATRDISKDIGDLLPTVIHEKISTGDTADDIRDYVRTVVSRIPILNVNGTREDIVQEIMAKASGSFLWVQLALDRLKGDWYTEADIKSALNELPAGMEALYRRMIQNVLKQSEKTRDMAMRILTWASCAFSPLSIAELEVALYPEFTGFVNLGLMAEEICGHFVAIKKSKVTPIHDTALKFLLHNSPGFAAPILEHKGHAHAASVCITFLSDTVKWRRIFNSAQPSRQLQKPDSKNPVFEQHPFLFYSLDQWAYHVSVASAESDEFLDSVLEFLEEHCLLWMHGVALTGRLRSLVRSAQYLKTYAKRRSQRSTKSPPRSFAIAREDELRHWANDIIRIVGRFGGNMLENPACISTLIVPFCPRDSIIAKTFGLSSQGGLSVGGLSSNGWDDCLARLKLGENRIAAQLLCKDKYLVTLLSSGGIVALWQCETFEELRKIKHGEYVTRMAVSRTSNLIGTAGLKTTKVWDITNGKELNVLPKDRHHHTKALSFGGKDDELWVAYDDCEIKCFDLETNEVKSSFLAKDQTSQDFGCARWITFNRPNTQVAIVFRGRPVLVWDIQESLETTTSPRRCVLAEDRLRSASEGDAWNSPEMCLWHPTQPGHLLILYEDTKISEWNIVDDEQMVYDHTAARAMTMSEDGSFLLTSDMNGTTSIWVVPGYALMYRMRYEELVTDLAFSPDGARFYDLRGSFCNAWEPDALIRADSVEKDDMSSTYETTTSEPVLASDDNSRVPVTSLVCDSSDRYYCVGKEDGSVTIHAIADGKKSRKVVNHASSSSVIKLVWSASDKFLASVDDSGRIIVKRLEPPAPPDKDRWAVFPVLDMRMDDDAVVCQVLFGDPRDGNLLVASSSHVCLFSLKKKKEICRKALASDGRTWLNHPRDRTLLVCLGGHTQQQYFWKDLEPAGVASTEAVGASSTPNVRIPRTIQQTVQVKDKWVLIDLVTTTDASQVYPQRNGSGSSRKFELIDLHKLPGTSSSSSARTTTTTAAAQAAMRQTLNGLAPHVKQLVGCFEGRVVFLDYQYWLCTWELELTYSKHKRHFFLPKDWVSPAALQMLVLNKKGALLCPRNGEVAIVRSGIR